MPPPVPLLAEAACRTTGSSGSEDEGGLRSERAAVDRDVDRSREVARRKRGERAHVEHHRVAGVVELLDGRG